MKVNLIKCNSQAFSDLLHSPESKETVAIKISTQICSCVFTKKKTLLGSVENKYMYTNSCMYILT